VSFFPAVKTGKVADHSDAQMLSQRLRSIPQTSEQWAELVALVSSADDILRDIWSRIQAMQARPDIDPRSLRRLTVVRAGSLRFDG
jgi:hypothetical protein